MYININMFKEKTRPAYTSLLDMSSDNTRNEEPPCHLQAKICNMDYKCVKEHEVHLSRQIQNSYILHTPAENIYICKASFLATQTNS